MSDDTPSDPQIRLDDYGRTIWRGRAIILVAVVTAAVLGLALTFIRSTTYTASSQVFLGQPTTAGLVPITTPATNPITAPAVLKSDDIIDSVSEETGVRPGRLRRDVEISVPRAPGSSGNLPTLVTITYTASNAAKTRDVTNSYAEAVLEFSRRGYLAGEGVYRERFERAEADVARLRREIESLRAQLRASGADPVLQTLLLASNQQLTVAIGESTDAELALTKTRQIEAPAIVTVAGEPSSSTAGPRRLRTVLIAALVGLLIGIVMTFAWRGRPSRGAAA